MGRLVSNQDETRIEAAAFDLEEFQQADAVKVPRDGWVEDFEVTFTDKGWTVYYEWGEWGAYVDEVTDIRRSKGESSEEESSEEEQGEDREARVVDGTRSAQEVMREAVDEDFVPVYEARGCSYEFEVADDPRNGETTFGVVVYCYGRDGTVNWSGATSVGGATRMIDAKRAARKGWAQQK